MVPILIQIKSCSDWHCCKVLSKLNSSYAPSTIMSFGTHKVVSGLTLIVVFVKLLVPDWDEPGLIRVWVEYGVEHLLPTLYVFIFKHIFISLSVIILVYFCWTDDNIKIEFFYLHEWLPLLILTIYSLKRKLAQFNWKVQCTI